MTYTYFFHLQKNVTLVLILDNRNKSQYNIVICNNKNSKPHNMNKNRLHGWPMP